MLRKLAGEFGTTRNDTIRFIVREWMEKNTYLPLHLLTRNRTRPLIIQRYFCHGRLQGEKVQTCVLTAEVELVMLAHD